MIAEWFMDALLFGILVCLLLILWRIDDFHGNFFKGKRKP